MKIRMLKRRKHRGPALRHARSEWLTVGFIGLLVLTLFSQAIRAQPVAYVGINPATGAGQLRVINSDGTGDRVLPVALPDAGFPSMSKDGRFMAITAQIPGRPNQQSRNIFLLDMLTAQLRQVTHFEDVVTGEDFAFNLPWYHSLSPDSGTIAVFSFIRVRNGTTPILQLYRVSDGFLLDTIFINRIRTGFTQGGDGVDWHPTQNLLVFTSDRDIPVFDLVSGALQSFPGEGAALSITPANQPGLGRQLTFPRSFYQNGVGRVFWAAEADYSPVFSLNGQQVAYVRATYIQDSAATGFRQPSILALRIVNTDGSNDHQVLALQQGIYVTRLSWSRTGAQLVFDAGNQAFFASSLANFVDANTDALWIVNADGSGLRNLRGTAAGFPVWTPLGTTFCNLPGVVTPGGAPGSINDCGPPVTLSLGRTPSGQFRLDMTGGVPNLLFRVNASSDLVNWETIGALPRAGATTSFTDVTGSNLARRFYRVIVGND
jgi:hypothetical protein